MRQHLGYLDSPNVNAGPPLTETLSETWDANQRPLSGRCRAVFLLFIFPTRQQPFLEHGLRVSRLPRALKDHHRSPDQR